MRATIATLSAIDFQVTSNNLPEHAFAAFLFDMDLAAVEAAGASVLVTTATHAQPLDTHHPGVAARVDAGGGLRLVSIGG